MSWFGYTKWKSSSSFSASLRNTKFIMRRNALVVKPATFTFISLLQTMGTPPPGNNCARHSYHVTTIPPLEKKFYARNLGRYDSKDPSECQNSVKSSVKLKRKSTI